MTNEKKSPTHMFVDGAKVEIPKFRMTELEKERYLKELETLTQTQRDYWNTPIDEMKRKPLLQNYNDGQSLILDPAQLYNEYHAERKKKNCSRCGFHFIYHIENTQTFIRIHEYDGEQKFWHEIYDLVRTTKYTPGTNDDPWYSVCTKCQADMKRGTPFNRYPNLEQARQELQRLRDAETKRNTIQQVEMNRLSEEYKEKRRIEREKYLRELEAEVKAKEEAMKKAQKETVKKAKEDAKNK